MDHYSWTGWVSVFFLHGYWMPTYGFTLEHWFQGSIFSLHYLNAEMCFIDICMWGPCCEAASLHFDLNSLLDFPGHLRFCYNHKWQYLGFFMAFTEIANGSLDLGSELSLEKSFQNGVSQVCPWVYCYASFMLFSIRTSPLGDKG